MMQILRYSILNPSVSFYASFDGHATADSSIGKGMPTGNAKNLEWKPGIWGQALQGRSVKHSKP
jgi:hypothetical protein